MVVKCSNSNESIPWTIFNGTVNVRVKYTHLHISYYHEKSTNI